MKKQEDIEYLEFYQAKKTSCSALFLHGYGANMRDLSHFRNLELLSPCHWIFPNGLLEIEASYSLFEGRTWFPLKIDMNNQIHTDKKSIYYLDKHCQQLLRFIQSLNINPNTLILGGFSQGAVMALNLALRMKVPPLALIIMSGFLFPPEILNKEKHSVSRKDAFFQCHGKQDPLLSYSEAVKIYDFLKASRWEGELVSFEGGHEIPQIVLSQIKKFMDRKLLMSS